MATVQAGQLSCSQFTDYLVRRSEHLSDDILRDITPTDSFIGHVSVGKWDSYNGVSQTFDRFNRVFPKLAGCWTDVEVGSCVGTPCDPEETKIGFGSTRDTVSLQERSYSTDLFCFDQVMTADRAKQQFKAIIESLKEATTHISSDRIRWQALQKAGKKWAAGATMSDFTFTTNADCTEIVPSTLPTSKLTVQMLMRRVESLKLNGYFGKVPGMEKLVEFVTDEITGLSLVQGNATLANLFRFDDFVVGGNLYKYGLVNGIGNFAFRYDPFPMRFQLLGDGVTLQRVFPYTNEQATLGIKGEINPAYVNARYQIDFIWNRMALQILTMDPTPVNPMMPFAIRDFAGKWQFVMDNLGATEDGCVIENKRRNKGMFISDFRNAIKALRPEWLEAVLTLREIACVVDVAPCSSDPGYTTQNYDSANDPCENDVLTFDISSVDGPYNIAADSILCNGVPIDHDASGDQANLGDLAVWLNANAGELGTWAWPSGTLTLTLTGSTCNTVTLTVT